MTVTLTYREHDDNVERTEERVVGNMRWYIRKCEKLPYGWNSRKFLHNALWLILNHCKNFRVSIACFTAKLSYHWHCKMIPIVIHGIPYSEECLLWSHLYYYLGVIDPNSGTCAWLLICRWEMAGPYWLLGLFTYPAPVRSISHWVRVGLQRELQICPVDAPSLP